MSETATPTAGLTSHYSAQVAGDLERNLKEQERLSGEIEALQEQLAAVRHDHTVLVSLQQALGVPAAPDAPAAEPVTAVPAPRKKATAASGAAKQAKDKKPAPAKKRTSKKTAATAAAADAQPPALPKLVDLVREHLAGQAEPRSAAEITTALGQLHPERAVKTTVVRTTLEGLVAKSQAQRTKQGTAVFYSAPDAPVPAAGEQTPRQSA
ncbi:hypothetical protein [Streptomyces sp. NBC_00582]|uniref:hypothetical protein n=1 Tax=Streptomyces sp. NBC_00582 TaxID=2975783 RepID=UPI002E7FB9FA|nr:hypothetical protein [Streptomyces sp. NBC_00582]WUB59058.1 hypothetical protein OG852_00645 [Streptomyces sp. NBC_00582]WUB67670.1 hypothetical protein OG852_48490 [Streptomyces sp. NBC_00582]